MNPLPFHLANLNFPLSNPSSLTSAELILFKLNPNYVESHVTSSAFFREWNARQDEAFQRNLLGNSENIGMFAGVNGADSWIGIDCSDSCFELHEIQSLTSIQLAIVVSGFNPFSTSNDETACLAEFYKRRGRDRTLIPPKQIVRGSDGDRSIIASSRQIIPYRPTASTSKSSYHRDRPRPSNYGLEKLNYNSLNIPIKLDPSSSDSDSDVEILTPLPLSNLQSNKRRRVESRSNSPELFEDNISMTVISSFQSVVFSISTCKRALMILQAFLEIGFSVLCLGGIDPYLSKDEKLDLLLGTGIPAPDAINTRPSGRLIFLAYENEVAAAAAIVIFNKNRVENIGKCEWSTSKKDQLGRTWPLRHCRIEFLEKHHLSTRAESPILQRKVSDTQDPNQTIGFYSPPNTFDDIIPFKKISHLFERILGDIPKEIRLNELESFLQRFDIKYVGLALKPRRPVFETQIGFILFNSQEDSKKLENLLEENAVIESGIHFRVLLLKKPNPSPHNWSWSEMTEDFRKDDENQDFELI